MIDDKDSGTGDVEETGPTSEITMDAAEVCTRIKLFEEWLQTIKEKVCEKPEGTLYSFSDDILAYVVTVTDPDGFYDKSDPPKKVVFAPSICGGP